MLRYFKFDFPSNRVIEYERIGECNSCGACCQYMIEWRVPNRKVDVPENWAVKNGEWDLDEKGIVNGVLVNGKWRYFHDIKITDEFKPCHMLTSEHKCKMHLGKSLIATAWPMSPDQVTAFKECSYEFKEIGNWSIAEFKANLPNITRVTA